MTIICIKTFVRILHFISTWLFINFLANLYNLVLRIAF
jgi:hypothetical protein